MFGANDVFYGFAVSFSTFKNSEVFATFHFINSSLLAITAIFLSTLEMERREPISRINSILAVMLNTVSMKSVRTSLYARLFHPPQSSCIG